MRAHDVTLVVVLLTGTACSVLTHVDVCERAPLSMQVVNTRTEGSQELGALAALPSGNTLAFFFSTPTDAAPPVAELRGALLDPSGAPLKVCDAAGTDFTYATTRRIHRIAAAAEADQRFVVAWHQVTGSESSVRFARFDDRFAVVTPPTTLDSRATSVRITGDPRLAVTTSSGTSFVTWTNRDTDGRDRAFGAFLDAQGALLSSSRGARPFRLGSRPSTAESVQSAVTLAAGGFMASWQERGEGDTPTTVHAVLFDEARQVAFANSACDATDFPLTSSSGSHERPHLARLANGSVLAGWNDDSQQPPDISGLAIRATVFPMRALLPLR